ncbi:MAG: glycosyltransferase family 2 protein [Eggerthellaceae bacterium]|nr:glycosyltransferase family 2 protein [Eggerthellaceae bacterium]
MSDTLYVVMPAYNESAVLPSVLEEWQPVIEQHPDNRLVVVNDGSTDETANVLERYSQACPQLVRIDKPNGGHGAALRTGYRYALSGISGHMPTFVFQTDSDGQTQAAEFPAFWKRRHEHDAIIGHRRNRGDGAMRAFVTRALRTVVRACTHVHLPDVNTPFRLMKTSALATAMAAIPDKHNLVNAELSIALARLGKSVAFHPISFGKRESGKNSINVRSITALGLSSIADFRELNAILP